MKTIQVLEPKLKIGEMVIAYQNDRERRGKIIKRFLNFDDPYQWWYQIDTSAGLYPQKLIVRE